MSFVFNSSVAESATGSAPRSNRVKNRQRGLRILRASLGVAGLAIAIPTAVQAKTINFHEANNHAILPPGTYYNQLFYGQGAATDPGNNVWNGFGGYGGPGSTYFYGSANNNSNANSALVPANNPGNPYASYASGSTPTVSTGTTLFSPTNYGANNPGNAWSDGTLSPVTLRVTYTGENGGAAAADEGQPKFILSDAALVSGTNVGTFTLSNVPAGKYNLFLYGANYDNTRGATFGLTSGTGTALAGITTTMNNNTGAMANSFVLGQTYVEFIDVSPNANGVIAGTYSAITNINSGLSGEGNFNGLQLQSAVPEPASIGLALVAGVGLLGRRSRKN